MKDLLAYMIGPKAENMQLFRDLIVEALDDHMFWRRNFYPQDLPVVRAFDQSQKDYRDFVDTLRDHLFEFLSEAKRGVPFFSPRYLGHMNTDLLLPALLGYFGAMLYNQNNVAGESSPVTVRLEAEVIAKMCAMVGYSPKRAFGYLSSGGSTANFYALWLARNLKTLPLTLRLAATDASRDAEVAKELPSALREVKGPDRKRWLADPALLSKARHAVTASVALKNAAGSEAPIMELGCWELLNLPIDVVSGLRREAIEAIAQALEGASDAAADNCAEALFDLLVKPWGIASLGEVGFRKEAAAHFPSERDLFSGPWKVYVAENKHYSWPKAMDFLGFGRDGLEEIPHRPGFDMDIALLHDRLKHDSETARNGGGIPLLIVSLFGSTEEGALDDLPSAARMLRHLPNETGLSPWWHVDAAYGGYLGSLLPDDLRSALASPGGDASHIDEAFGDWAAEGLGTFTQWLTNCCEASGLDCDTNAALIQRIVKASESGEGTWLSWSELLRRTAALREAHSITIDPHKLGYIPYPAGAVLVRYGEGRELVSYSAPYLWASKEVEAEMVGRYTVEGSRPGATAAACWLAHTVAPLDPSGHGRLIALSLLATRYLYLQLSELASAPDEVGRVVLLHQPHTNILCYVPFSDQVVDLERCRALTKKVLAALKPVNEIRPFMTVETEVTIGSDSPAFTPFDPRNHFAALLRQQEGRVTIPVVRSVVMGPFGLTASTRERTRGEARPIYGAFAGHLSNVVAETAASLATDALNERVSAWSRPVTILVMDDDPSVDQLLRDALSLQDPRLTREWKYFDTEDGAVSKLLEAQSPIDIAFLDIDMEGSSSVKQGSEEGGYHAYEAILQRNTHPEDARFRVKLVVFFTKGAKRHEKRLADMRARHPGAAVATHTLDKGGFSEARELQRIVWQMAKLEIDD